MTIGVPEQIVVEDPGNPSFEGDARLVRLVSTSHIDDHDRPRDYLWGRFHYPETLCEILLWRDGTTVVVNALGGAIYDSADYHVHSGWVGRYDSWQARVLRQAGFPLVVCDGGA